MQIQQRHLLVISKMKSFNNKTFKNKEGFEFKGRIYDQDDTINDTNVIQYEFINLGVDAVIINDTIELLPFFPGANFVANNRFKPDIYTNECDNTIYKIKFVTFTAK